MTRILYYLLIFVMDILSYFFFWLCIPKFLENKRKITTMVILKLKIDDSGYKHQLPIQNSSYPVEMTVFQHRLSS